MKDELKYKYALTKNGEVVDAANLDKQLRLVNNNEFYVEGFLESGETALLPVMAVIGSKKRPHFRGFSDPKKQIVGFHHNKEHFGEVILHKLGKKVISGINGMVLPDCIYRAENVSIPVSKQRFIRFSSIEIEKTFKTSNGNAIRYDAFALGDSGEKLGIEVLVTHSVDSSKREKIIELGHEAIEIDLSDLIDKTDKLDIEKEIHRRLSIGANIDWIVNSQYEKVKAWQSGLIKMDINRAAYTSTIGSPNIDDAWFVWAADYSMKIPKCPHIQTLINAEKTRVTRDKYLESNQCKSCGRCIVTSNNPAITPKNICGTMLCNQSDISNQEIFSILASGLY